MIRMNLIKKNKLDLEYQKNLQYFNTTIIAMFTYAIGLVIAIFTRQIPWTTANITLVFTLTTIVYLLLLTLITVFRKKMNWCLKELSKLK